jgi:hypothetical protein
MKVPGRRSSFAAVALTALVFSACVVTRAQDDAQGPMAPPPKFEVKRIPTTPHPGPPPIPEQEIIQKFAANEDVAKKIYDDYVFKQTIRIEELNNPGGKFTAVGDVYTKPDGSRYWRPDQPIQSDLKMTSFAMDDVHTIIGLPLFFLTADEIGNYDFLYAGETKLDELTTYVFQVKPKQLSRTKRYFQGAVWVDTRDLALVKTFGKFVGEVAGNGTKLPFTMFETYRENFQEKYWLPTYSVSDEYLDQPDGSQLHLRLVVHDTDFKFIPTSGAPATPSAPAPGASTPATPAAASSDASLPSAPKPQAAPPSGTPHFN